MRHLVCLLLIAGFLSSTTGCVAYVFNEPVTVSTKSIAASNAEHLKPVSATLTNYLFILIPIPSDPRDIYDDLLEEAKAAGGNAVVDVQIRNKSMFFWVFPTILIDRWEAEGIAAIVE